MGLYQVHVFECDFPSCYQSLELPVTGTAHARFLARGQGWVFLHETGEWFCTGHATVVYQGDGWPEAGVPRHEDWCPFVTRHSACMCSARPAQPVQPMLSGVAYRRIQTVRNIREDLL